VSDDVGIEPRKVATSALAVNSDVDPYSKNPEPAFQVITKRKREHPALQNRKLGIRIHNTDCQTP
jgi:hypothetical protein